MVYLMANFAVKGVDVFPHQYGHSITYRVLCMTLSFGWFLFLLSASPLWDSATCTGCRLYTSTCAPYSCGYTGGGHWVQPFHTSPGSPPSSAPTC